MPIFLFCVSIESISQLVDCLISMPTMPTDSKMAKFLQSYGKLVVVLGQMISFFFCNFRFCFFFLSEQDMI